MEYTVSIYRQSSVYFYRNHRGAYIGDPGNTLTNNYFTVSGSHASGTPDNINILGTSAVFFAPNTNTDFSFYIQSTAALGSFVLDDINIGLSIMSINYGYSLSNVYITGTKVGGGQISVGPVTLNSSNTVVDGSDFPTWNIVFSGQQLTSIKINAYSGNDNGYGTSSLLFNSFTASNMTAPGPTAPSTPDLLAGSDSGSSNSDNITSNTTPTFTGTAVAGSTVKLYDTDGTTEKGNATADESGNWSITSSALATGPHSITAKATDGSGTSAASSALSVTIDNTAPDAPSTPNMTDGTDSGTSNTDNITSDTTPTISGTAEAGSTVKLYDTDGTTEIGSATATGGNWTITSSALAAGAHTITAKATDVAGNTSVASSALSLTIDTTGPAITFSGLAFSADTGTSNTDFITKTAAQTITATLSGAPAETDLVYGSMDNGTTWTDITAKVTGTALSWDGATLAGSDTLKLKVTDSAGNDGTDKSQAYVLDTTGPAITFSGIAFSADTGTSSTDFITKTAAQTITATLSGAPAGSDKVYGSIDNGTTWTDITSKVSGTTLTWDGVTLAGSDTLMLKVVDNASNDGTVKSQAYVLATAAPTTTVATVASQPTQAFPVRIS